MTVRVQAEDFDISTEIAALRRDHPGIGAIASFIGVVRDVNEGDAVAEMTLEHYPGMTEKSIEDIITQARGRWEILEALVIHRVGILKPTDQIVLVVVAGEHRRDAFLVQRLNDRVKPLEAEPPLFRLELAPARFPHADDVHARLDQQLDMVLGLLGGPLLGVITHAKPRHTRPLPFDFDAPAQA